MVRISCHVIFAISVSGRVKTVIGHQGRVETVSGRVKTVFRVTNCVFTVYEPCLGSRVTVKMPISAKNMIN